MSRVTFVKLPLASYAYVTAGEPEVLIAIGSAMAVMRLLPSRVNVTCLDEPMLGFDHVMPLLEYVRVFPLRSVLDATVPSLLNVYFVPSGAVNVNADTSGS